MKILEDRLERRIFTEIGLDRSDIFRIYQSFLKSNRDFESHFVLEDKGEVKLMEDVKIAFQAFKLGVLE